MSALPIVAELLTADDGLREERDEYEWNLFLRGEPAHQALFWVFWRERRPLKRSEWSAAVVDGTHTNGAVGFYSRIQRMVIGNHHHIGGKYAFMYCAEAAVKEDWARNEVSMRDRFLQALRYCAGILRRPPA